MQRPDFQKAVMDFWAAHGGMFGPSEAPQAPARPPIVQDVQQMPPPSQRAGVPDMGFGPMTPVTQGGYQNPQPQPEPWTVSQMAQDAATVGSFPARAYVDQINNAGAALAETAADPSLPNITNAGFQTAMTLGQPGAALKMLGAGYAAAAGQELLPSVITTAEAAGKKKQQEEIPDLPGLTPEQMQLYRIAKNEGRTGAMKRLEDISADYSKQQGAAQAEGARVKAVAEAEAAAATQRQQQQEYNNQVTFAEGARDKELARERRFSETPMGQIYDKTGGAGVIAAGVGAGALHRVAKGPANHFLDKTVVPILEGAGAGFAMSNLPLLYNAFATEVDNPEKRAYQAYARELPEGHPKKAPAAEFAETLPDGNPIRKQAHEEFYDDFLPRLGISAIEGGLGALVGRNAIDAVTRPLRGKGGNAFATPPAASPSPQPDLSRMSQSAQPNLPQTSAAPISPPRWARQNRTPQGRWDPGYRED